MQSLGWCVLYACLLVAADASKTDGAAGDLEKLQGFWTPIAWTHDGVESMVYPGPDVDKGYKGDRCLYGDGADNCRFAIDPTKSPKTMDVFIEHGRRAGATGLGIYKFDGDLLTICSAITPLPRPTDFTAPQGSKRHLITYKRKPTPKRAAAPDGKELSDKEKFQGFWDRTALTLDGDRVVCFPGPDPELGFRGDKLLVGDGIDAGRYVIDPTKSPKTIELHVVRFGEPAPVEHGIYKFEGDTLIMCVSGAHDPRPTDFTAKKGSGRRLDTFTRFERDPKTGGRLRSP